MATQLIFAGTSLANPTTQEQVAVLGSTAQGATVYSTIVDPAGSDTLQNASFLNGISSEDFVKNPNPSGVLNWDSGTTYNKGDYTKDSITNFIYVSQQNGNTGNLLTDTEFWKLTGTQFLPFQEAFNSLGLVVTTNIAEIQSQGIVGWSSTTPYLQNGIVKNPSTQDLYISLIGTPVSPNLGNPLSNTTAWKFYFTGKATTTKQGGVIMATGSTTNTVPDNNLIASTYAPLNSATLTGTPTAPTRARGDNSTKIATTEFVTNNLGNLKHQINKSSDFTLQASETGAFIVLTGSINNITLPSLGSSYNGATFIALNQTTQQINLLAGSGIVSVALQQLKPNDYCILVCGVGSAWKVISYGNVISPTAPTPATNDNSTKIATTGFVKNNLVNYAPLNSATLTGTPTAPTPATNDNSTKIATTGFVKNALNNESQIVTFSTGLVDGIKGIKTITSNYIELTFSSFFYPNPAIIGDNLAAFSIPIGLFTQAPEYGLVSVTDYVNNVSIVASYYPCISLLNTDPTIDVIGIYYTARYTTGAYNVSVTVRQWLF